MTYIRLSWLYEHAVADSVAKYNVCKFLDGLFVAIRKTDTMSAIFSLVSASNQSVIDLAITER